jgi:hypothetical protein
MEKTMDHRIFEGILHGVFGGLFGPAIAQWLRRYKYWIVFLSATLATQVGYFIVGIQMKGFREAMKITFMSGFDPLFFLVPMGIGLLAVFVAFVGSLDARNKNDENSPK